MMLSEITKNTFTVLGRQFKLNFKKDSKYVISSEIPFGLEFIIENNQVIFKYDIKGWDCEQVFVNTTNDFEQIYLEALNLYEQDVIEEIDQIAHLKESLKVIYRARANKILKNVDGNKVIINGQDFKVEKGYLRNYIFRGPTFSFMYMVPTAVFTDINIENEFKELDLEKAAKFYQDLYEKG